MRSPPRALPTETKVESGTSQSKSGTSVNLRNSGDLGFGEDVEEARDQVEVDLVQGLEFRVQ